METKMTIFARVYFFSLTLDMSRKDRKQEQKWCLTPSNCLQHATLLKQTKQMEGNAFCFSAILANFNVYSF